MDRPDRRTVPPPPEARHRVVVSAIGATCSPQVDICAFVTATCLRSDLDIDAHDCRPHEARFDVTVTGTLADLERLQRLLVARLPLSRVVIRRA